MDNLDKNKLILPLYQSVFQDYMTKVGLFLCGDAEILTGFFISLVFA